MTDATALVAGALARQERTPRASARRPACRTPAGSPTRSEIAAAVGWFCSGGRLVRLHKDLACDAVRVADGKRDSEVSSTMGVLSAAVVAVFVGPQIRLNKFLRLAFLDDIDSLGCQRLAGRACAQPPQRACGRENESIARAAA